MTSGPRGKEIYVSGKTKKRLFWLKQLFDQERHSEENIITLDAIADRLLNEKIEADYPNIKILEKRLDALEGQLISELLNPSGG